MITIMFAIIFSAIVLDHFRRKGAERLRTMRFLISDLMGRGFSLREIAYINSVSEEDIYAWYDGRKAPLIDDVDAMQSTVLKARDSFIMVHQQVIAQKAIANARTS